MRAVRSARRTHPKNAADATKDPRTKNRAKLSTANTEKTSANDASAAIVATTFDAGKNAPASARRKHCSAPNAATPFTSSAIHSSAMIPKERDRISFLSFAGVSTPMSSKPRAMTRAAAGDMRARMTSSRTAIASSSDMESSGEGGGDASDDDDDWGASSRSSSSSSASASAVVASFSLVVVVVEAPPPPPPSSSSSSMDSEKKPFHAARRDAATRRAAAEEEEEGGRGAPGEASFRPREAARTTRARGRRARGRIGAARDASDAASSIGERMKGGMGARERCDGAGARRGVRAEGEVGRGESFGFFVVAFRRGFFSAARVALFPARARSRRRRSWGARKAQESRSSSGAMRTGSAGRGSFSSAGRRTRASSRRRHTTRRCGSARRRSAGTSGGRR
eukprot:30880-Pelagococcus_subviridis.AAC.2